MKNLLIITLLSLSLIACGGASSATPTTKQTQSDIAADAADSIQFTENYEIKQIKKRLEMISKPGLTGFVLLMNEAGQPIMYTGVDGKPTSGGKRLTKGQQLVHGDRGEWNGHFVMKSPSDEGTWGSSNPYIYFWTTTGQYIQWNGKYLYSDKPFRTKVDPLVITIK